MIISGNKFLLLTFHRLPSNLSSSTVPVNVNLAYSFNLKLSYKNVLKFALRGNCFFNLFTEVQIWN